MLKLQYFGHLMWRVDSFAKTLLLGKIEGRRWRGLQRMRWFDSITDSMDMNLSKLWDIVEDGGAWSAVVHGVAKSQAWLSYWTTTHLLNRVDTRSLESWHRDQWRNSLSDAVLAVLPMPSCWGFYCRHWCQGLRSCPSHWTFLQPCALGSKSVLHGFQPLESNRRSG